MIEILVRNKVEQFSLTRKQMKDFSPYFQVGLFVDFMCEKVTKKKSGTYASSIQYFIRIFRTRFRRPVIFYDVKAIRTSLKKIIERKQNRMFLDLEFTMPSYNNDPNFPFKAEIIQYGAIIEDPDGKVIYSETNLVWPTNIKSLNGRIFKFLNIDMDDFDEAISYLDFYENFKKMHDEYKPTIYVWGKNDFLVMENSYIMHHMESITSREHFINFLQIIKNYFNSKNDIGLFRALSLFNDKKELDEQTHNALIDASVLREVFHEFKKLINNPIRFSTKNIL
jgi:sporulation inhibitor KapD